MTTCVYASYGQNEDMLNNDVPVDMDRMMMNNWWQDRGQYVDVLMDDMKFDKNVNVNTSWVLYMFS